MRRPECVSGKKTSKLGETVFFISPQTSTAYSEIGFAYDEFVSGNVQYLFNQLGSKTRDRRFYAAEEGTIETSGWENPSNHKQGYGYRVKLRAEGDNSLFVYAHVDPASLTISLGDLVTQGQLLGQYASPANGGATGPHLHFEWWSKTGARLDSISYLPTAMPNYVLKDTIRFRSVHPVTGKARWHNGYDLVGPWSQP